jgi:virulence-associated protein VapD
MKIFILLRQKLAIQNEVSRTTLMRQTRTKLQWVDDPFENVKVWDVQQDDGLTSAVNQAKKTVTRF